MDLIQVQGMVKTASPIAVIELVSAHEAFTLADQFWRSHLWDWIDSFAVCERPCVPDQQEMMHQSEATVVEGVARRNTVVQSQQLEQLTVRDEARVQNLAQERVIPGGTQCNWSLPITHRLVPFWGGQQRTSHPGQHPVGERGCGDDRAPAGRDHGHGAHSIAGQVIAHLERGQFKCNDVYLATTTSGQSYATFAGSDGANFFFRDDESWIFVGNLEDLKRPAESGEKISFRAS
jgi:hypothetical protein